MTEVALKNCTPFIKCITKIDGTTTNDAENLVMLMHNLLEYSFNYYDMTCSLWFYSKDEVTDFNNIADTNDFKSSKDKAKLLAST